MDGTNHLVHQESLPRVLGRRTDEFQCALLHEIPDEGAPSRATVDPLAQLGIEVDASVE